jgi:glycosyltransferase involved in cell wall biosynthesis
VYIAPDYLAPQINLSFIRYLVDRFNPETFYIANGASWIYDAVSTIKKLYPKLHTVNQVYDHAAGWINRYDPPLVANLDSHIGCNRKICQAYIENGVPPNRAHLIENGVDVSEYNPECYPEELKRALKNKFGLPPDKKVITFISRLHQQKRPMDFVELARRFQTSPLTIFFMVGDGPLSQTVDAEVKSMRLNNFIRLPFYRPSSDIFAVSDVIVLPSEYEGMPMVILEAQAMGIPVVATDVGNIRDVLNVTGGGRVVARVGDVTTLQTELKKVLEKPINPIKVRQAVIENFGLEKMLAKYYDVLAGYEVA